jgi:hypothetical protein
VLVRLAKDELLSVIDMIAEQYLRRFVRRVPELEAIWRATKAKGLDRLSLREINTEIKAYRQERKKRVSNSLLQ